MKKRKHSRYYQALNEIKQLRTEYNCFKGYYDQLDKHYNTLVRKYLTLKTQYEEEHAQNNILRLQVINMKGEPHA